MHVKVTNSSDTCERVRPKNILKQPKQTRNSRFNGESYRQFKTKTNFYTRGHGMLFLKFLQENAIKHEFHNKKEWKFNVLGNFIKFCTQDNSLNI